MALRLSALETIQNESKLNMKIYFIQILFILIRR